MIELLLNYYKNLTELILLAKFFSEFNAESNFIILNVNIFYIITENVTLF